MRPCSHGSRADGDDCQHGHGGVAPKLDRYAAVDPETFWAGARAELAGLPGGRGLNIAHEAVDRHLAGAGERVALRFIARDGTRHDHTYADLARETSRFANALRGLGVTPGDLVCSLAGRVPELCIAALGTLKARSAFSPLFSAFGPEPIRTRLELGRARVLVTTEALSRRKVEALRPSLPDLGRRRAAEPRATLSADHRASDGHVGSAFLRTLDHLLQDPAAL
jgi:acetyl-CoA synthetase